MTATGPGQRSMEGLEWLARVGPASTRVWSAAMGWTERTGRSHALRLERAKLLGRAPRLYGAGGAMVYATASAVALTDVQASVLRREPSAVSAEHHEACAEMAALLTRQGLVMRGPRELLANDQWVGQIRWHEHGETRQRGHRPDLIATASDGGFLAFEVELHAKSPARLTAVLRLYLRWLAEGKLSSLGYVVGSERERRRLLSVGAQVGLAVGPQFGIRDRAAVQDRLYGETETLEARAVAR
jgi:hypothetical protein